MGFFDCFKKKTQEPAGECTPRQTEADTLCLLVMDRVMEDASRTGEFVEMAYSALQCSGPDTHASQIHCALQRGI